MRRRHYPSSPLERTGQVNYRKESLPFATAKIAVKGEHTPDCVIIVTKKKGFGSLGNKESSPMSDYGFEYLKKCFPQECYYRYKVNVYLKP